MLIIIDSENCEARIYSEQGLTVLDTSDTEGILNIIGNEVVYFVTGATEADKTDIKNILDSVNGSASIDPSQYTANSSSPGENDQLYMKSNVKGLLVIPDPEAEGDAAKSPLMTFESEYDCKPYSEEVVNKAPLLKQMIQKGHIKIINRQSMLKCNKIHQKNLSNYAAKHKELEDKKMSCILVDENVKAEDFAADLSGFEAGMDIDGSESEPLSDNESILKSVGM